MKRFITPVLAAMLALAVPAAAQAATATIELNRTPAPPSAVTLSGSDVVNYSGSITFSSKPHSYRIRIFRDANDNGAADEDPANDLTAGGCSVNSLGTDNMAAAVSPFTIPAGSCTIPANAAEGAYLINTTYYTADDLNVDQTTPDIEHQARVTFYVRAAVGNLTVRKFEDTNGNGQADTGEKPLANWKFTITAPDGKLVEGTTDANGEIKLTNIIVGTYTVNETMQDGWNNITPIEQKVVVGGGSTKIVNFLNARPANICGTVYEDTNRDGKHDAAEATGLVGLILKLTGLVDRATKTDDKGGYCFNQLNPGDYTVTLSSCGGELVNTGDADGKENGLNTIQVALTSGVNVDGRDFGCNTKVEPPVVTDPPVVTG